MRELLLVCFLPVVLGVMAGNSPGGGKGGWGDGLVLSRRHANGRVYQLIKNTLSRARDGITVEDLEEAAKEVGTTVDAIIDEHGRKVSAQKVYNIIQEIAARSGATVTVSGLFDDALTYEGNLMDAAFNLWNDLADKEQEIDDDDDEEDEDAVLGAISITADSIQEIVKNSVRYFLESSDDDEEEKDRKKRWEFNAGVNRGPHGGTSYSVGVSHSWRRRATRATRSATKDKRQDWKGSLGVDSNGLGGAAITGGIDHSFGNWKSGASVTHDTHRGTSYGGGISYNDGPLSIGTSVNRDSFGGTSYGGSLSYNKGGFSAGVNVNRHSSGGTSYGVGLRYRWRRRR